MADVLGTAYLLFTWLTLALPLKEGALVRRGVVGADAKRDEFGGTREGGGAGFTKNI